MRRAARRPLSWLLFGVAAVWGITAAGSAFGRRASAASDARAPRLVVSGPVWELRGKTLRGGLWDLDYTVTARESTASLRVVVRINGRIQHREATRCRAGSPCVLRGEDGLDTETLPRGRLHVRVTASDDRRVSETAFMLHSTPVPERCPRRRYRVFFLGRRFAGVPVTSADQLCERTIGNFAGVHSVTFTYGNCGVSVGACQFPLTLSSGPLCEANPQQFGDPPKRTLQLLHVPAALYDPSGAWVLEIYTGHTTIGFAAADDSARSRRLVLSATKHLHYAPSRDIPDGSRTLRNLPVDAHGPATTHLPQPNQHELNSATGC